MKKNSVRVAPLLAVLALAVAPALPCTNYLVTKGASSDGATYITYSADAHTLYGSLVLIPPGQHLSGELRDVYEWDTGKYFGKIKEAQVTYAVVGNINEHQVSIGETTFGGREELQKPKEGVDYGSLMYIALQRAKTAREAIKVMTDIVAEYGYRSEGESMSVADPNEAWIFEIISKGETKGAIWVARRIPDGCVSAHANQARIRQFPLNDPDTLYAKDIITFAREKGWFKGEDRDFSFVDVYAPPDFGGLRACEARVWAFFRKINSNMEKYIGYVRGNPKAEPIPLWIKPDRKLGTRDLMELMRDHFEGTEFDLSKGVGAGPFALPYRWRPMTWKVDGQEYVHERAVSTQQTGWSMVSQLRANLPGPIGGVLWFGVDDTFSTVYVPMYAGIRKAPHSFDPATADFQHFSWDSAFWVFNWVANWTYTRYSDMIPEVQKVQREFEGGFLARQPEIEAKALTLWKENPELARDFLTSYSVEQGERVTTRWRQLGEALFVKYLDGNVRDELGNVTHPNYPEGWYRRIVQEEGEVRKVKKLPGEQEAH